MKEKLTQISSLIIIFVVFLFYLSSEPIAAVEPLIIGVPHSEEYTYATMMKNSFEMALEVINKKGGIKGRPLKLVYGNDRGEIRAGVEIIKELVRRRGAIMLVGAYQSSNTKNMAGIADALDRPFLVCTAADDQITRMKWKNVYRLNPPVSEYAKGLEDFFLKKIRPKSIAVFYENSPFGTGLALRMMYFCRDNDIKITAIMPYHKERAKEESIGAVYFQRVIRPLKEEPPDVVYMGSYLKDGALLIKKIRELKIKALLTGGAGGFTSQKFITTAGKNAENLLTATLWTPQLQYPGTKNYYNQYIKKYSTLPDYHGAEAYSALLVAADALKRAESFRPDGIRAALDKTDMITPFGPVKFKSYGKFERQNSLPTQVLQIVNDKFECVWPQNLATSNFVVPPDWRVSE